MDINTLKESIKTLIENISDTESLVNYSINIWLWIAIIELVLILYLIFHRKESRLSSDKEKLKKESMEDEIDFENIIKSSFHVKPLYDELKIKCHPDRFPDDEVKSQIALNLFQEISKNKTNYKKLLELKELAKNKLNVKF